LRVVNWWLGWLICEFQWWWVVGFDKWVLILILRLMGFDFDYDFFRLIGYVVVDGGWVYGGDYGGWVYRNRLQNQT